MNMDLFFFFPGKLYLPSKEHTVSLLPGLNLSNKAKRSGESRWITREKVAMQLTPDHDISATL